MASLEETNPEDTVNNFIAAMNEWENEANRLLRAARESANPSSYQEEVLERMNTVFLRFCTPKDRPYGRLGSFSQPPEYDPSTEVVTDSAITGRTSTVTTQRNAVLYGGTRVYNLQMLGDSWLIDNVKRVENGKLVKAIL